jgi:hypothetical protein
MSVCLGSAWKILPITARSLWSVLGGEGRESPVKHVARGASTGGGRAGKDRVGALCTRFTLVKMKCKKKGKKKYNEAKSYSHALVFSMTRILHVCYCQNWHPIISTKIFKNINKVFYSFIKDKIFHNIILYFSSSFLD